MQIFHKVMHEELKATRDERNKFRFMALGLQVKIGNFNNQPWWKRLWQAWKGIE